MRFPSFINFFLSVIIAIISTAQSQVPSDNSNGISDLKIFRGPRHDEFDWALTKVSNKIRSFLFVWLHWSTNLCTQTLWQKYITTTEDCFYYLTVPHWCYIASYTDNSLSASRSTIPPCVCVLLLIKYNSVDVQLQKYFSFSESFRWYQSK